MSTNGYIEFLGDYDLNVNDDISLEFQDTYREFYEHLEIESESNSENLSDSSDEDLLGYVTGESDDSLESSEKNKSPKDFTESDFLNMCEDVCLFMKKKCLCLKYLKKYSCCYNFKPQEIDDIRKLQT